MEFELWLYAIKQLAQNYEMSQVIYSQLTDAEKADLHREYETTIGGGADSSKSKIDKDNKTLKEYRDLVGSFHNAMSIVERFAEKNSIKQLNKKYPIDEKNPDEVFIRRMFVAMEADVVSITQYLNHIVREVTAEGDLKLASDGNYYLNDIRLQEGIIVEFFHINRWEIGRFCKGPSAPYGCFFLGYNNEIYDVDPEGLHVRLRG